LSAKCSNEEESGAVAPVRQQGALVCSQTEDAAGHAGALTPPAWGPSGAHIFICYAQF